MFKSIRTNLFAAFLGLITLFLVSILVINVFFLDDLFIFGTQQNMRAAASHLKSASENTRLSEEMISEEAFQSGLFIGVLSERGVLEYNAGLSRMKMRRYVEPSRSEARGHHDDNTQISDKNKIDELGDLIQKFQKDASLEQNFYIEKVAGPRRSVILLERLSDGKILLLMKPILPLKDSSHLVTVFTLTSGAVVLFLGSIAVFVFSGRLTAPILNMDRVARKMANLDFSEPVNIASKDELGALGNSIQSMSENLHSTLSELKRANEKLQLEIEMERKIDQQRRRFISSVSHELRTPLSMIQGYADGLRHGVTDEPEGIKTYCGVIVDETKKMSSLIRDMLDLSSYEAGAFNYTPTSFDLAAMVRSVAKRMATLHTSSNIVVNGMDTCVAYGDSGRIEQVLLNFANNALNYSVSGEPIRIFYGVDDQTAFLKVANVGPTIPENQLDQIWNPFYKIDESAINNTKGFGLGLAIAQAIAEAHGGKCTAENIENGVVFGFMWPSKGAL